VCAADEERALDEISDADLMALAVADERILITANARDFLPLATMWAEAGRQHAGIIVIVHSIRQHQFGAIVAGISTALAAFCRSGGLARSSLLAVPQRLTPGWAQRNDGGKE
jgi:hypothetical protein